MLPECVLRVSLPLGRLCPQLQGHDGLGSQLQGWVSGGGGRGQVQQQQAPAQRPPADDRMAKFVSTVLADTEDVWKDVFTQGGKAYQEPRLVLTFPVELPANTSAEQVEQWLSASGFTKVQAEREVATPTGPRKVLDVVADRFRLGSADKARVVEAIETALKRGSGRLNVYKLAADDTDTEELWRYSTGLHCPESDLRYPEPLPSMFSFNSALGACDTCRGFGRVIGVDYGLVIPNDKLTLRAGVIKTIQTPAWKECQDDLMRHAETAGIPRDTAWNKLTPEQQHWVIQGSPNWTGKWNQQWYGIKRFFEYLETKSYKMHIRVLLSKYRSYTPCGTCGGAGSNPSPCTAATSSTLRPRSSLRRFYHELRNFGGPTTRSYQETRTRSPPCLTRGGSLRSIPSSGVSTPAQSTSHLATASRSRRPAAMPTRTSSMCAARAPSSAWRSQSVRTTVASSARCTRQRRV